MKKFLVMLLFMPFFCSAQEWADTLSFNYQGVDLVDSVSAKMLMSRARLFVAETFKSAKNVIQLDDQESNVLLVKGTLVPYIKVPLLGLSESGYVHFTLKIQAKDGKYKYGFSEFSHESVKTNSGSGGDLIAPKPACGTFLMSKGYWRQIKADTNKDVLAMIDNLHSKMKSSELTKKEDF